MLHGYARVSTPQQELQSQLDALAFCDQVHQEVASTTGRLPVLTELVKRMGAGDTLVVTRLDRLGRSVVALIRLVEHLQRRRIYLRVLAGNIDTTTAQGRFFLSVVAAFSELERDLIQERTQEGLRAAKAKGKRLGRPRVVSLDKLDAATELIRSGMTVTQAARVLGVSRAALYKSFPGGAAAVPEPQIDLL